MPYVQVVAPDLPSFLAAFTPFEITTDYQTYMRFDNFIAAWESTGLGDTLQEGGPYTFFVPIDAAIEALPGQTRDTLLADPDTLRDLLLTHVAQGTLSYEAMLEMGAVTTLQGAEIAVGESQDDGLTFTLGEGTKVYNFPYTMSDGSLVYFIGDQLLIVAP